MNMGSLSHTHAAVDKMKYKLEIHYNDRTTMMIMMMAMMVAIRTYRIGLDIARMHSRGRITISNVTAPV